VEDQERPFAAPEFELQDSRLQAEESRLELEEETAEADFGEEQEGSREAAGEGPPTSRRRRRRRGRRGVMREDAFLGIERLAMEDIAVHESVEPPAEPRDESEGRDDAGIGEEITSIVIGGDEEPRDRVHDADRAESEESEFQHKRRRRRRRGRRVKERDAESQRADIEAADEELDDSRRERDEEADEDRPQRARRSDARVEKRSVEEDGDDLDDDEDAPRPNKNLHKEVTPWAEAIGYIVSANMEARARNPGGGQRGRWGKGDRR
jgi:hypothetical protein